MKKIIITLTDIQKNQFFDVEVPVDKPFNKLKKDIVDTLNGYVNGLTIDLNSVEFLANRTGKHLAPDETMEDAGIWNGDYITIVEV